MITSINQMIRRSFGLQRIVKLMFMSDVHYDNPKCRRDLFFKDLERAKKAGARVGIIGDFFCLMNGKYDPRRSLSAVRPEHKHDNYIDLVVEEAASDLAPYADIIDFISDGNHETAIRNKCGVDVLDRLIYIINKEQGVQIQRGKYQGFYRCTFDKDKKTKSSKAFTTAFHHGAWGGVISKGVQGVPRFASIFPDADLHVSGHTHDKWAVPHVRYKLCPRTGKVTTEEMIHLKCPTYKEEFAEGKGWAIEKIVMPKSVGGAPIVTLEYNPNKNTIDTSLEMPFTSR